MAQSFDRAISPTPHCYEIQGRAAEIARSLGSPVAGAEHLFLAMLHDGGFPVSVIRDLVDLDAAETAVLAILAGPDYSPPAPPAVLVRSFFVQLWGAGTTFGFNIQPDERTWVHVIGADGEGDRPGSRAVLTAALASLNRPGVEG